MTRLSARAEWPTRSLVADLPGNVRDHFLRLGTPVAFERGDVLIAEGVTTTEVYVIVGGFVRVLNHSRTGDETMIAIRTRGDLVGELAALDGMPRTSTVIAAGKVIARKVDGLLFRSFTTAHPYVGEAVARSVVSKLRAATRYRVETGAASVLTRVSRVLEHLVDGYGRSVTGGMLLDVPLPQRDLASLAGTSEKGVYRAYDELRRAGVIDVAYRQITVLDNERLLRYADGAGGRF
ncbi:Crp/Fnr family transcriptional regulator [Dactylosporangium sp. NPDC051485]|uniref:Crp/Fnr family transcriptional regulator n=1 Tax=Dactylosporangium sp. NPDC051485 TaxID=3154846 RepID=UPI003432D2D3